MITRSFLGELVGDREHTTRSRCTCALDGMCLEHSYFLHDPGDCHPVQDRDYWVVVCAECRTASCWHGDFMCERSRGAKTVEVLASTLRLMNREDPSNFSEERLHAVCGRVDYVD